MTRKKKAVTISIVVSLFLLTLIGYRVYTVQKAEKARAAVSGNRTASVQVQVVGLQNITPKITASAVLEPVWYAEISPKVEGRMGELYVEEGLFVSAGSVIAVLDSTELQAQLLQAEGNYYAAQANVQQAELDLKRAEELVAKGAAASQTLDNARIKRDLMYGQLKSAEGNVNLLRTRLASANVTAPRSGVVLKKVANAGSYMKAGQPIITLGDTAEFIAKASVGENQIGQIKEGQPVEVTIESLNAKFQGTITRISPVATLPGRTFTVEISVANTDQKIKMGMFGKADIPVGQRQALVVPASALVFREDQNTVFVLNGDTVTQRKLTLGFVGDGWAEVLEGVHAGEQIVIAGQNKIRDGAKVIAEYVAKGATQ